LPSRADDAEPPLPIRLHAAETALRAGGLEALWAPLVGWASTDTFRLALALGVAFEDTWDCRHDVVCGQCEGCAGRVRALKQLGMRDPLA
jgi:7-cyano-7-deazaguanine synthase in queuosine biosynthesis